MKNNVNMVKGVIKLTKPMILIQMATFIPYDDPMGLNRKIKMPIVALTYVSLFLAAAATFLHLFDFCAAASVIAIVGFLRSLFDRYSGI
ncbi:hypothetical protein M9H77_04250 [Catharanthus roseus]|uniref:Uncharacterized protein n=1 Tax=Catharanthus roseus TaxID=4058 RepID=A0ACC0CDV4_CATRO|nr:hypothetical protein M9H77_04250 [Catharanthus roseus]